MNVFVVRAWWNVALTLSSAVGSILQSHLNLYQTKHPLLLPCLGLLEVLFIYFQPLSSHLTVTGSHESYIRAIIEPACSPVAAGGLGYRGVVLNFRGCE